MSQIVIQAKTIATSSKGVQSNLHIYVGITLLVLFLIQASTDLRFEPLYQLQENFVYKQMSGIVFLSLLLNQWRLYINRSMKISGQMRQILYSHRFYGAISPMVLYLHAMELGYALQAALSVSYLLTVLSGLLTPYTWGIRHKVAINSWLIIHVLSAALAMGLLGFHIYVVYWFG